MSSIKSGIHSIAVFVFCFSFAAFSAQPNISYVSGSGPHPLGTTVTDMIVSTDVNSGCRFNDIDDGNTAQWTPLSSSDQLLHSSTITLSNDEDITRYIRCKNLSTNEINSTSFVFSITFDNNNSAPNISTTAITSATEDSAYLYDVDATDSDVGDVLTYSLTTFPSGMTVDSLTGIISWTPVNDDVGDHTVLVVVTDGGGLSDSQSFVISVANVNDSPTITSAAITAANENSLYSYDVEVTDPDVGDSLTFSLVTSPLGMTINPTSGLIDWTPDSTQLGDHTVSVLVADVAGFTDSQDFTISVAEVNVSPSITSTAITTGTEDLAYLYDVNATDPNVDETLTFSLTSFPSGMTIDASTGVIDWIPSNEQVGDQSVVVLVSDSGGLTDSQSFIISVSNVNDAPSISSVAITTATDNVAYVYDVDATDPDAGETLTYTITTAPSGMSIDSITGMISWTPTSAQVGNQSVVVVVTDLQGATDSQSFTIVVSAISDIGPVVSYVSGSGPYPLGTTTADIVVSTNINAVCRMNDVDDGSPVQWSGMSTSDSLAHSAQVTLVNDQNTTRYIRCRSNSTGEVNTISFVFPITFEISNTAPTITSTAITTATQDIAYIYDVTADDPDVGDSLVFSLSAFPEGMTINSTSGMVDWLPTNAQIGNNDVTVVVSDSGGLNDTQDFTVVVGSVNEAPNITSTAVLSASDNTAYLYDVDATDPNVGDVLSFSLTTYPVGMTIDLSTGVINWTPNTDQIGDHNVDVTVTDDAGLSDTQSFVISVADINNAPSITSVAVTSATENSSYAYDVDATDPDTGDSLSFSLVTSPSGMSIDSVTGIINWTPTNIQVGNNDVSVVATDVEGLTDTQSFTITVADVNEAPSISSTAITTAEENVIYAYDVNATDPDVDDNLTFSLTVSPVGMTIDSLSGMINWTPETSQIGNHDVTVIVTDDGGLTDSQSFIVVVVDINDAPSITSVAVTTATENVAYIYDVEASDPDTEDLLIFSLTIWPDGMTINPDTGIIDWLPTDTQLGTHSVVVQVADGDGLSDSQSYDVEVTESDSDGDGVVDSVDQCADTPIDEIADENGCSPSQLDSDNDGITDDIDQCPNTPTNEVADATGCSPSQNADPFTSSTIPQTGADTVISVNDDASLAWGTSLDFTRNDIDETVVDNTNNLTWLDDASVATMQLDWNGATSYCAGLDHANINTWRLPTKHELLFLLNYSHNLTSEEPKVVSEFVNTASAKYWTDFYEIFDLVGGGTDELATAVNFATGEVSENRFQDGIETLKYVRCVSGDKPFEPSFSARNSFHLKTVIIDSANRLMWQDNNDVTLNEHTWNEAIDYCENLELDDSTDWRLPNVKEYFSLIDEEEFEPVYSISGAFWTSTSLVPDGAFQAAHRLSKDANNRFVSQHDSSITQSHYVRCVRDYAEPVAVSGGDRTAVVGELITFDGGASFDPDGTIIAYQWVDPSSEVFYLDEVRYSTSYSRTQTYETSSFGIGTHEIGLSVQDNNLLKNLEVITLTVVAEANIAPVATSETVEINEDEPVDIILQATDSNGDTLTYEFVDLPTNGEVVLVGLNTATYTPNLDFFGTDSFTFKTNDGALDSNVATISINVNQVIEHPLEECAVNLVEDDYGFVDTYPEDNIDWVGVNYQDVSEIEEAFNHARYVDTTIFQFLSMPNQATWDSWTIQQKGLYLINAERDARGLKPYEGTALQVETVASDYAEYIRVNNEVISHYRSSDGASPLDRLNENTDILNNQDFPILLESIYARYGDTPLTDDEVVVQAVYGWIYYDKFPLTGAAWGHRAHMLQSDLNENSGASIYEEGLIGFGISSGLYDPDGIDPTFQGSVVVLNSFDPSSSWELADIDGIDITSANKCNNNISLVIDETGLDTTNLISLSISPTSITLNPGESAPIQVFALYDDGAQTDITSSVSFVADARSVVSVDLGEVTAINSGKVTLFATINGVDSNRITVLVGEATDTTNLTGTFAEDYLNYVPTNGTIESYDPKVFSLFTGIVTDRNGVAIPDVIISFHGASEFGNVLTDANGRFTIAGHAGSRTLVYAKEGYLTVHRGTTAISNAWATLKDVILLELDSKKSTIDLTSIVPQVHQSTIITDEFGSRATTLVFDNVSSVTVTSQDGSTRNLDNFLLRATEYELPNSMPADLPLESAFTYCSELDIVGVGDDEAVTFDNPVVMYVDNFLNFAVGEIVPIGYYTGLITEWEASQNGVVVKLLDASNDGLVDGLDYTGDDIADDIDGDGSTFDEIAGIENYTPGAIYWRGSFDHFSAQDTNWPYTTGMAVPVPEPEEGDETTEEEPCTHVNSYVKPRSLTFHEDIPVTGTGVSLHYSSQRTQAYHRKIRVGVSGATIEPNIIEMIAVLEIAGNRFEQVFAPEIHKEAVFVWDGKDVAGIFVEGVVKGKVSIGYRYNTEYFSAGNVATSGQPLDSFPIAWAQTSTETTGVSGRENSISWNSSVVTVFNTLQNNIANGWSLSNHHVLSPYDTIYKGDGSAVKVKPNSQILITGITTTQHTGDDGFYQKGGSDIDYEIDESGNLVDKITGLRWEYVLGVAPRYSLKVDAEAHCEALNSGGEVESDTWRFPTSKEIAYTIDKSNSGHAFLIYHPDALTYWVEGRINPDGHQIPLVCVKGEKLDDRYIQDLVRNNTDEVVVDPQNGLMWQDTISNSTDTLDWKGSLDYCEALDHAGFTDWRLPNINELLYALPNVSFNFQTELEVGEPWTPGVSFRKPYWSSSPDIVNEAAAWAIESASFTAVYTQDELYYSRCVRDDTSSSRSPYVFDQDGKHIKTIDLDSGITLTTFEYNDDDQLISFSDRFGNTVTVNRDAQGKATSIVSPDGYTTTLTVDTLNDLTRAEYDDATGYDFVYQNSLMTEETDPNGNLFVKTYDTEGRIINTEDPEQGLWEFFNVEDEVNKIMTYGFTTSENNRFEVAESTLENGDTSLVTTEQDESVSDLVRQADDLKETFTSSDIVTVIDKVLDPKTKLEIPQTITTTLPSGLQSITTIDKSYAENGTDTTQLTISIANNGQTNSLSENFKTGVRTLTSAEGRIGTLNFDPLTRLLQSQQVTGLNEVSYLYDSRGRLTTSTIGGRVTTFAYDDPISKGNITSITDAENRVTSFEYDLIGRLTKTTYHDGRVLEQGFDGNGNLTSLTPPGQPAHIFNYNSVDKETQYTPPDLAGVTTPQTIYDYDRDRKLTSITRPDNQVITFNYRLNTDQLTSLSIPTGDYSYGYDSNQELTSITAPGGVGLTFTLDGALQTKSNWTGDIVGEVEIVLDNQFKIAEQKVNGANSILLGYDNDNLLTSAGSLTITRDVDNGLITGSSQTNVSTSRSYNSYAEMLNYNATYNASQLYNVDYTRDNLGRITQQIETIEGGTQTLDYDYDLAGRLIQVKTNGIETESYDYDDNGNRTHINGVLTATYDAQDRLLTHSDFVYTYTDNGELLTKTDTGNNDVTSYVYDVIGNLIEVNLPDTTKIEYVIDGLNRRVGKKINGTLVKGWLYQDQLNPVAELDGNNNITARFVYGDKINVPSYMEKGGQTYRIISDHLGSPRLVVNVATGVVEQRIDFDTWGNVSQDTNSELQPFGFAGGLYEAQTGLTRFGARDYDGAIGRWTSKDPIRFNGGDSNLFGYVFSDPVNFIDPTGLITFSRGVSASIFGGTVGGDGSIFVGIDSNFRVCMQIRTCGSIGLGLSTGVGVTTKVGTGVFCEGEELVGGLSGGLGEGIFARGNILSNGDDTSVSLTVGGGGGASLAGTTCLVKTVCLN